MKGQNNTNADMGGEKAAVNQVDSKLSTELKELQNAADKARESYDHENAITLYSRYLNLVKKSNSIPPTLEYKIRSGRAACYSRMGDWLAEFADLDVVLELGEKSNEKY